MAEPELLPLAGGEAAVFSARGPDKDGPNEDAACVIEVSNDLAVLLVADGLGGQPAGQNASEAALRALIDSIREADPSELSLRGAILDGFERANSAVQELGVGAGTTLVACELAGDTVRPYHVGDSSILVVGQRGKLKLQTVSHSPVGYAVEAGMLDETEALHHDDRHLVSNVIGDSHMRIEIGSPLQLSARDTVLLATDGLLDNVRAEEIVETTRCGPLVQAARSLAQHGLQRMLEPGEAHPSKPDDLTYLLYRRSPGTRSPRPQG
ncbi:MAG: PP2C family protein-serine/threonine phosphatase [Myxococcota bacterium]